jgi:hypothetical protein
MSRSGTVEIARVEEKRRFVTPAQAGIHLRGRCKADENLDSGLPRIDDKEKSSSSQPIQSPSLNRGPLNSIIPSLYYSDSVLGALS